MSSQFLFLHEFLEIKRQAAMFAPTFGVDALLGELTPGVENDDENSNVQLLKRLQRRYGTQRYFARKYFLPFSGQQNLLLLPLWDPRAFRDAFPRPRSCAQNLTHLPAAGHSSRLLPSPPSTDVTRWYCLPGPASSDNPHIPYPLLSLVRKTEGQRRWREILGLGGSVTECAVERE